MSENPVITEAMKAQVEGQNSALDHFPTDLQVRADAIRMLREKRIEEAREIQKAKKAAQDKVGAEAMEKTLIKDYGWRKLALKTLGAIAKITDPMERGAISRQIYEGMKLEGFLIPELFDEEREAKHEGEAAAAADDKPVFDNTPQGSKAKAKPPVIGAKAPPKNTTKPTPAVDLRVAAAKLELSNWQANNTGKLKAAQKKELAALEAKVAEAEALALSDPEGGKAKVLDTPPSLDVPAETGTTVPSDLPEVNPDAPTDAELPELPAAEGDQVSKTLAAGAAESAAHIAGQVASETPAVPVKAKRQSAAQKKAAAEAAEAEAKATERLKASQASEVAGPDGPDDDEETPFKPVPNLTKATPTKAAPVMQRLG